MTAASIGLLVVQASPFCNINCDYCYLPDRQDRRRMSSALLRKTFENVLASEHVGDSLSIVWYAGEPLAVPIAYYREAFQEVDSLAGSRIKIFHSFQSNGVSLNEAWCDFIEERGIRIGLSIDGPAFLHDAHRKTRRGTGTHAQVMNAARLLHRRKIDFHAISVITTDTLSHADEFFSFFADLGVTQVGLNIEEVEGVHERSSLGESDANRRVLCFLQRLLQLQKDSNGAVRIREFDRAFRAVAQLPLMRDAEAPDIDASQMNDQVKPFGIVSIDVDGNISTFSPELLGMPSQQYGSFRFGNVQDGGLDAVIDNPTFRAVRADLEAGTAICRETCDYFAFCGGGAPSNKYFENGSFASGETMYCRFTIKMPMDLVLGELEGVLGIAAS